MATEVAAFEWACRRVVAAFACGQDAWQTDLLETLDGRAALYSVAWYGQCHLRMRADAIASQLPSKGNSADAEPSHEQQVSELGSQFREEFELLSIKLPWYTKVFYLAWSQLSRGSEASAAAKELHPAAAVGDEFLGELRSLAGVFHAQWTQALEAEEADLVAQLDEAELELYYILRQPPVRGRRTLSQLTALVGEEGHEVDWRWTRKALSKLERLLGTKFDSRRGFIHILRATPRGREAFDPAAKAKSRTTETTNAATVSLREEIGVQSSSEALQWTVARPDLSEAQAAIISRTLLALEEDGRDWIPRERPRVPGAEADIC